MPLFILEVVMAIAKLDDGTHWAISYDGSSWYPIYVPAPNITIEHTNVASADSGRTEDGKMHITWVRRDVRKVNLVYNAISGYEKSIMEKLMQGKEFYFRYIDPHQTGDVVYSNGHYSFNNTVASVESFYGYTGESKYQEYSSVHYASEGGIYTNFTINVIEK